MGLYMLLFQRADFDRRYNCSFYDYNAIPAASRQHPMLGFLMILLAISFSFIYIPCLLIFRRHLKKPAYKIMFFIGAVDITMLMSVAAPYGVFSITGDMFCANPTMTYAIGSLSMGLWASASEASVILALNRCLEMWKPSVAETLFKGKRTLLWFAASLTHNFCAAFFTTPLLFTPLVMTMVINPHVGFFDDVDGEYTNYHHLTHNTIVFTSLLAIYAAFLLAMHCQGRSFGRSGSVQRRMFLQVLLICSCSETTLGLFLVTPFVPHLPEVAVYTATFAWICSHGMPAIICLAMNQTVREGIKASMGASMAHKSLQGTSGETPTPESHQTKQAWTENKNDEGAL